MTQEFYNKLETLIKECEAHPYKASRPIDMGNGYEGRISKENLGTWTSEDYKTLFNHLDEKVDRICEKSSLDCFVYCAKGGYIYLVFN